VAERHYKGYRVYAYIALARLFAELDLDLGSEQVLVLAPEAIRRLTRRVSKEEILHAIRSNSHMTDKVLEYLVQSEYASVSRDDRGYDVRITTAGVAHLRRYREFYRELYARELREQYRYVDRPGWLG
jgi:predicted transcriptional regulator